MCAAAAPVGRTGGRGTGETGVEVTREQREQQQVPVQAAHLPAQYNARQRALQLHHVRSTMAKARL
jgi:hypothetical protein